MNHNHCPLDIFKQINGKRNTGLLIAVYVVFTTSMTTAFLIMWPGTIMWAEVGLTFWSEGVEKYMQTRSLGALRAPTSSWRPFGPLDFVLRALRALRPCDPRIGDWIGC